MKKIISVLFIGIIAFAKSQVIIGSATGTAITKTSVLLEFADTNDKGIILPYLRTLPADPAEGTIILDASENSGTKARVKYFNGSWVDLSGQNGNVSAALVQQPNIVESATVKSIIGAPSSAADGILVLESTSKAMVLPHVTSVAAIAKPAPGMMVYVAGVAPNFYKRLAVFNGTKWSYWKP